MRCARTHLGTARATTRTPSTTAPRRTYATGSARPRILITGGLGQIGVELARELRAKYGRENVIVSDVKAPDDAFKASGPFAYGDVLQPALMERIVVENGINWLVHNTSILSASGERDPSMALKINVEGLHNMLDIARRHRMRVLAPSSIAAFGPTSPREMTPNLTVMRPTTIYGVTKVYLELLGEYYTKKYGLDFRSLRYPGVISSETLPGGGTTDYAVDIFYKAIEEGKYECFLGPNSELPMMYMPDCLGATIELLEADSSRLKDRVFNVAAFSFTPAQLAAGIAKQVPGFKITYKPDFRQAIADSWPKSLDDSEARAQWAWKPKYDMDTMTKDMLEKLRRKLAATSKQ